ncbi:MAG: tagaturonate reductase [Clostridia bacterium]|nr:tagaturonate reductase [Clostridia bacterium]
MIKVLQYGEGNFLRTFVDLYFDTLNKKGLGEYSVSIIKPITLGSLDKFVRQNNKYHVVLRGYEGGKTVEDAYAVNVLNKVIDPFGDRDSYYTLAKDKELRIIVSNTTEAGICYNGNDKFDDFEGITYPAKLTKFLYERFKAGLDGVYLMPVELIDNNADKLSECVSKYIKLWNLPLEFENWNKTQNFYCNTLVDRIVSGYPKDVQTIEHITSIIGCNDELVSIGEPFGFWAVEKKGDIAKCIKEGVHNIEVALTDDISYYKKRKVRVLNGSHTNLVPVGLVLGLETVYDCMNNEKLLAFMENTLKDEIIPFVSNDAQATIQFADSVKERFMNPYLNHQLTSISLNSISKWGARVLPSFKDYFSKHGKIAPCLTIGFSYLLYLYSIVKKHGEKYFVKLKNRTIELVDNKEYLERFANEESLESIMSDASVWGENLTTYAGFCDQVLKNMDKIDKGICLI